MARDGAPTRSRQPLDIPDAYSTTDFSLVVTLATLGMKLVNSKGFPAKKGEQVEWREISTKLLKDLGIDFEKAVKRGLGDIAYGIHKDPNRNRMIKAFREARAMAEKGESQEIPDEFEIRCECGKACSVEVHEFLAKFAGHLFANRKYLADRRPKATARLRTSGSSGGHSVFTKPE